VFECFRHPGSPLIALAAGAPGGPGVAKPSFLRTPAKTVDVLLSAMSEGDGTLGCWRPLYRRHRAVWRRCLDSAGLSDCLRKAVTMVACARWSPLSPYAEAADLRADLGDRRGQPTFTGSPKRSAGFSTGTIPLTPGFATRRLPSNTLACRRGLTSEAEHFHGWL